MNATSAQQPSLKALARAVLERNYNRNRTAIERKKERNFWPQNEPSELRYKKSSYWDLKDEQKVRFYPMVRCGDCMNFNRDTINPKGGMGQCRIAGMPPLNQKAPYPFTKWVCQKWVAEKPEPLSELSQDEETSIRAWLAYIEETDPAIIAEVLNKCRDNRDARRYFLKRSEEVPEPVIINRLVSCGDCIHFDRVDHLHLGHCAKGQAEAIAGLWDTDRRYCEQYQAIQNEGE
jgi:hypothetical protein